MNDRWYWQLWDVVFVGLWTMAGLSWILAAAYWGAWWWHH